MSKDDLKKQIKKQSKTREGTNVKEIQQDFKQDEEQKPHTLTIRPSYIDKMKDYVHWKKTMGDPYYTQGDVLEEALTMLFGQAGEIPPRPEEIRRKEKRRTGRRKGAAGSKSTPGADDVFS